MITSLFLLFVAAGILIGSIIVVSGSFIAFVAGFAGLGILTAAVALLLLNKRAAT